MTPSDKVTLASRRSTASPRKAWPASVATCPSPFLRPAVPQSQPGCERTGTAARATASAPKAELARPARASPPSGRLDVRAGKFRGRAQVMPIGRNPVLCDPNTCFPFRRNHDPLELCNPHRALPAGDSRRRIERWQWRRADRPHPPGLKVAKSLRAGGAARRDARTLTSTSFYFFLVVFLAAFFGVLQAICDPPIERRVPAPRLRRRRPVGLSLKPFPPPSQEKTFFGAFVGARGGDRGAGPAAPRLRS